jgi:lysophospholipase L1-like esterase
MTFAGKRVLLVGDSHSVGGYGLRLEALFREAGADVKRLAVGGMAARDFAVGKYSDEFRAMLPADVLVVSLGTNDASNLEGVPLAKVAQYTRQLAVDSGASVAFYVGPPAFADGIARTLYPVFANYNLNQRAEDVYKAVAKTFPGIIIDSRPLTSDLISTRDIHFSSSNGKKWAERVFQSINEPKTSSASGPLLFGVAVFVVGWMLTRRNP